MSVEPIEDPTSPGARPCSHPGHSHAAHDDVVQGDHPDHVTEVTAGGASSPRPDTAAVAAAAHPSMAARPLIGLVRGYQYVSAGRPSPCRHVPSCSTYAVEALQIHGAVKGLWLAARRLARCQPWGTQGYDPVPERKAA